MVPCLTFIRRKILDMKFSHGQLLTENIQPYINIHGWEGVGFMFILLIREYQFYLREILRLFMQYIKQDLQYNNE